MSIATATGIELWLPSQLQQDELDADNLLRETVKNQTESAFSAPRSPADFVFIN